MYAHIVKEIKIILNLNFVLFYITINEKSEFKQPILNKDPN